MTWAKCEFQTEGSLQSPEVDHNMWQFPSSITLEWVISPGQTKLTAICRATRFLPIQSCVAALMYVLLYLWSHEHLRHIWSAGNRQSTVLQIIILRKDTANYRNDRDHVVRSLMVDPLPQCFLHTEQSWLAYCAFTFACTARHIFTASYKAKRHKNWMWQHLSVWLTWQSRHLKSALRSIIGGSTGKTSVTRMSTRKGTRSAKQVAEIG